MRLIIKGFKLPSTDLQTIEKALSEVQNKAAMRSKKLYAELLAAELENLIDDISLNAIERPKDISLYEFARKELDTKIAWASANRTITPYNFTVQAAVFSFKGESYIKVDIKNERLLKEIRHISDAEDFNVEDSEYAVNSKEHQVWDEIQEIYSNGNHPLFKQLFPIGPIEVEWERIVKCFSTREERAERRVRYNLTNNIVNLIGMGQEIPNHKLLPYLDEAMLMLNSDTVKAEAARLKMNVLPCIVNITKEDVMRNPNDLVQSASEKKD